MNMFLDVAVFFRTSFLYRFFNETDEPLYKHNVERVFVAINIGFEFLYTFGKRWNEHKSRKKYVVFAWNICTFQCHYWRYKRTFERCFYEATGWNTIWNVYHSCCDKVYSYDQQCFSEIVTIVSCHWSFLHFCFILLFISRMSLYSNNSIERILPYQILYGNKFDEMCLPAMEKKKSY